MNPDQLSEEQIFDAAFALESDDARDEYLQQVCRDEGQFERIQALLKAGAPGGSFLEQGPAELQATSPSEPEHPQRIGDFEILGELGRGGMGIVYRARQCSLNRLVALKVLSAGLGLTTRAIMRFKLEAEAAAKLHHTNIVPIYWTGEEKRVPYYAMELIDGPSLDRVIKQLRAESSGEHVSSADSRDQHVPDWINETLISSSPQADDATASTDTSTFDSSTSLGTDSTYYDNLAKMMAGVADALAHAHDHGIVHRDIKPANLLLSADGRLSINDFGLARMLEQPGMTMTGELMGSPMYMSPEQITAGRLPLDHRTDIYSLGATLYELLTLQPPFPGQQRDQVLAQVIHKDPPKPRSVNPRIPKDLETICMKAMEKDPDRRYQTAELLAEDLRRFVNRHAILARRTGPLEKGIRWVRKNKAISAMACPVLVACLGVGVREYRQWKEDSRQHAEELRKQKEERYRETMIAAEHAILNLEIDTAETHLNTLNDLAGTTIETDLIKYQIELLKSKGRTVAEELSARIEQDPEYASDARIHSLLARAYTGSGQWKKYTDQVSYLTGLTPKTSEEKFYKARVLIYVDFETSHQLIKQAGADMAGYADFWLSRAKISTFRAIARGRTDSIDPLTANPEQRLQDLESRLKEIEDAEDQITTATEICGEDVYMVYNARLYALLCRTHLLRSMAASKIESNDPEAAKGDQQQAEECLNQAEFYVDKVAEKPHSLNGNFNRSYYYDLRLNPIEDGLSHEQREDYFRGLESVVDDANQYGHVGWLTAPYWAYCLKTKQYDRALTKLESGIEDDFAIARKVIFQLSQLSARGPVDQSEVDRIYMEAYHSLSPGTRATGLAIRGNTAEIEQFFEETFKESSPGTPEHNLSSFYLGERSADDFLKKTKQTEYDLVTAYLMAGRKSLIHGDREAALDYFRKSSQSTVYHWTTMVIARTYATKLDRLSPYYDPDWLRWLPAEPIDAIEGPKENPN